MGMFSWMCCVCDEAINADTRALNLVPKDFGGKNLYEPCGQGYGVYGGRDVYALITEWNAPESITEDRGTYNQDDWDDAIRDHGIVLGCGDDDNAKLKYPIKIVCGRCCNDETDTDAFLYENCQPSPNDPNQGFNWGSYMTQDEIDEEEEEEEEANTCEGCCNDTRYYDCECEEDEEDEDE